MWEVDRGKLQMIRTTALYAVLSIQIAISGRGTIYTKAALRKLLQQGEHISSGLFQETGSAEVNYIFARIKVEYLDYLLQILLLARGRKERPQQQGCQVLMSS